MELEFITIAVHDVSQAPDPIIRHLVIADASATN
jgi:hypothetical protein